MTWVSTFQKKNDSLTEQSLSEKSLLKTSERLSTNENSVHITIHTNSNEYEAIQPFVGYSQIKKN